MHKADVKKGSLLSRYLCPQLYALVGICNSNLDIQYSLPLTVGVVRPRPAPARVVGHENLLVREAGGGAPRAPAPGQPRPRPRPAAAPLGVELVTGEAAPQPLVWAGRGRGLGAWQQGRQGAAGRGCGGHGQGGCAGPRSRLHSSAGHNSALMFRILKIFLIIFCP